MDQVASFDGQSWSLPCCPVSESFHLLWLFHWADSYVSSFLSSVRSFVFPLPLDCFWGTSDKKLRKRSRDFGQMLGKPRRRAGWLSLNSQERAIPKRPVGAETNLGDRTTLLNPFDTGQRTQTGGRRETLALDICEKVRYCFSMESTLPRSTLACERLREPTKDGPRSMALADE